MSNLSIANKSQYLHYVTDVLFAISYCPSYYLTTKLNLFGLSIVLNLTKLLFHSVAVAALKCSLIDCFLC